MNEYRLTGQQINEIFNVRLRPHLPAYLTKVEPSTYHIHYTFQPFTGSEPKPEEPNRYWEDPNLAYQHADEKAGRPIATEAEYALREAARFLLDDVYRAARIEWKNARHVAELKATVKNTDQLWKAHNQAKRAVEAAFAYLRDPEAAKEWTTAISRLIDTQNTYLAAAIAFDDRAQEIAEVHERHFHEEMLGYTEALTAAGFPQAKDWPIASTYDYGKDYCGEYRSSTLAGQAQALIKTQEAHVAKVGRLAGQATNV
ncbi:hypothetical protein [Streptomyces sp. SID161]|uniref:hypothetical protein n=1 Tax=Streptomyces sp. SID161 TaxID=2690251 RepID=UPI001368D2D8|nr:hypothetical protein [Streptomyces sp. SID161]MYW46389.1 hypothetical protein [Streptomyces sp. SID161]